MIRNLVIQGNCLGTSGDLEFALQTYSDGNLKVPLDSICSDLDVRGFLERRYLARERFGKVVYQY